jgi:hypothetical protein
MSDYVYQPYPRWMYSPRCEPVIVNDPGEEEKLGAGWYRSPAQFPRPGLVELPEKKKGKR